jgi:hypothetical protein
VKYLIFSLLLLSSVAQAQKTATIIYQSAGVRMKDGGVIKKEVWYASDTAQKPFTVAVYEEHQQGGQVLLKQLLNTGQAMLAGEADFIIVPGSRPGINKRFADRRELLTTLSFRPVSPGRWIVRSGTWTVVHGPGPKKQDYTTSLPVRLELDKLLEMQSRTDSTGAETLMITNKVLDSGTRIDAD